MLIIAVVDEAVEDSRRNGGVTKKCHHKPLLEVIISEVFSDMEDTKPEQFASAGVKGMNPFVHHNEGGFL